jgi:lipopolysaccharide export system protein LptA
VACRSLVLPGSAPFTFNLPAGNNLRVLNESATWKSLTLPVRLIPTADACAIEKREAWLRVGPGLTNARFQPDNMNQPMKRECCYGFRLALAVLTLGLAMFARPGHAQPLVGGQGFKFAEYFEPPHETQMKSLLEGNRATRLADGRIQVEVAKYRTFRQTGEGELVVEAPQCVYDSGLRTISSSGPLHVQTADGKFSIEGEGFCWQQTNATLQVSNRVHTIIHPELLRPGTAANLTTPPAEATSGMEVFSDQFEYSHNAGQGAYQGHVRVVGTNLNSSAEHLTILLPAPERRLKTLTAEQNVVIDYVSLEHGKIVATGGRAFYSADSDLVQMTGQPTWRVGQREGSGDELIFDRTNNIFRANGHASLRIPAQGLGSSGLFSRTNAAGVTPTIPTNQFVEITCHNYELRTNLAAFREEVRVRERLGDQVRGQMTCRLLTLSFTGTNELQTMLAEHQVVIEQEDRRFTAETAEFTGTNRLLELKGDPRWQAPPREGKGDLIRVDLGRDEMLVQGNASMRLPAAELGRSAASAMGKTKRAEASVSTNEFADVFSEEYLLTMDSALFRGQVRIEHPQMNWSCPEITMLTLPALGQAGRMIIAEPEVVFNFTDDQGRTYRGTGDKVVYTHRTTGTRTNDIVELTGKPAMLQSTNLVGRNAAITLDLASHKLIAPGKYKLWGAAPPSALAPLERSKAKWIK